MVIKTGRREGGRAGRDAGGVATSRRNAATAIVPPSRLPAFPPSRRPVICPSPADMLRCERVPDPPPAAGPLPVGSRPARAAVEPELDLLPCDPAAAGAGPSPPAAR